MTSIILSLHAKYWFFSIVIYIFAYYICKLKKHTLDKFECALQAFLLSYIFLVFSSTVLSRQSFNEYRYELMPFASLYAWYKGHTYAPIADIYNVIMFYPIGLLLAVLMPQKMQRLLRIGVGMSLLIEFLQLILQRGMFEVDDIILNTLGTLLGGYTIKGVRRIKNKYEASK